MKRIIFPNSKEEETIESSALCSQSYVGAKSGNGDRFVFIIEKGVMSNAYLLSPVGVFEKFSSFDLLLDFIRRNNYTAYKFPCAKEMWEWFAKR